jgi:adenylate kinase
MTVVLLQAVWSGPLGQNLVPKYLVSICRIPYGVIKWFRQQPPETGLYLIEGVMMIVQGQASSGVTAGNEAVAQQSVSGQEPRVVFVSRPGSGKGTQGKRLAERLEVQYLSTGDLLRRHIASSTALGRAVARVVNSGGLIPTLLMVAIVEGCVDAGGYVLDGFPRTVDQASTLLGHSCLAPNLAVELLVPPELAMSRLASRGRVDDTAAVVRQRLALYENETAPVLDLLASRSLLRRVDGSGHPDEIAARVWHEVQPLWQASIASPATDKFVSSRRSGRAAG